MTVDADVPGFGKRAAQEGDLLLVHYKGTLSTGEVFDSTLGGEVVRTNASSVSIQPAAAVPRAISLRVGDVQPGVCAGLRTALLGMRVGGKRTVTVPPELGFGQVRPTPLPLAALPTRLRKPRVQAQVAAPYAVVPPGSTLRYELQLLRLSSTGPDALFAGVAQCGIGGAGAQMAGCDAIVPQE